MNIEARLYTLQLLLENSVQGETPIPATCVLEWLSVLRDVKSCVGAVSTAMQQVANVNMALALTARLLEAAHTEKLDADQIWCLIDPLREKLDSAVEDMRLSL
jgi:hypothetical protein